MSSNEAPTGVPAAFACGQDATFAEVLAKARSLHRSSTAKPKIKTINVPVWLTLMIKKFEERGDEVILVGTMVQRTLYFDLRKLVVDGQKRGSPTFGIRLHDIDASSYITLRKVLELELLHDGKATGDMLYQATSLFRLPMKKSVAYSHWPFNITAISVDLSLTSFVGGFADNPSQQYEFRPDLLCHTQNLSNLICIRDWQDADIDQMKSYDLLNVNPTVEYTATLKKSSAYVGSFKMSYFCGKDAIQPYLSVTLPLVFAAMGNFLNMRAAQTGAYGLTPQSTEGSFLAKAFFLGVLTINITHLIGTSNSTLHKIDVNKFLSGFIFIGLCVGLRGNYYTSCEILSNVFMLGAIVLQNSGAIMYYVYKSRLRQIIPKNNSPWNFVGKSVGSNDVTHLCTFWEPTEQGTAVGLNSELMALNARHGRAVWLADTTKKEQLVAFNGVRLEDFQSKQAFKAFMGHADPRKLKDYPKRIHEV